MTKFYSETKHVAIASPPENFHSSLRSYCQPLRECLRLPSNRSRPGITSHRAGTKTTATASVILRSLHCPHRPISATNEDGTSHSNGKQVIAGRHGTTESPPSETASPHRLQILITPPPHRQDTLSLLHGRLPEIAPGCFQNRSRPGITSHRAGARQRLLRPSFTTYSLSPPPPSRLPAANWANPGGMPTLTLILLLATPPPDQSGTALDPLPRYHKDDINAPSRRDVASAG